MSWEEDKTEIRPCPCGKGKFKIVYLSDDWGRHEERWSMQCPKCAAAYKLRTYYSNHKGITETHHEWVPRPSGNKEKS